MKLTLEIRKPGWVPSRIPKWSRPLVLVLTLAIGVPVVLATDGFIDVPTSSLHHDDVNRLATAGVTVGCGVDASSNPLFCPNFAVTREQMATFLVRGLGRIAEAGWYNMILTPADADGTPVTIVIATGIPATALESSGYLKIDGYATFTANDPNPCRVSVGGSIRDGVGGPQLSEVPTSPPQQSLLPGGYATVAFNDVVQVGSGTYEIVMSASAYDVTSTDGCASTVGGNIAVTYIPFDGDANNPPPAP